MRGGDRSPEKRFSAVTADVYDLQVVTGITAWREVTRWSPGSWVRRLRFADAGSHFVVGGGSWDAGGSVLKREAG